MAASELALGENHPATRTEQPMPRTMKVQLSEIAHHKDGDDNHGITIPIPEHTPSFLHE
jgi:hypothetical protein